MAPRGSARRLETVGGGLSAHSEGGKALCLTEPAGDLDKLMETLNPEGVWVTVSEVPDQERAEKVLQRISTWEAK